MSSDRIAAALHYVHERFTESGVWHCLAYGTLLGAIRDGDCIAWDNDFDLLIQPRDVQRILAMTPATSSDGYEFRPGLVTAPMLAVNPAGIDGAASGAIGVWHDGAKIADLYAFTLFDDGVLRRFDVEHGVYWVPHSSFAHFFVERLETATIRGRALPVPQHADRFLADTYGADWRTPYRAMRQGGAPRHGATVHGDVFEPHLRAQLAWCDARGWDRAQYAHEYRWPRSILAAGPVGPTERTRDSSRALWWRSKEELATLY